MGLMIILGLLGVFVAGPVGLIGGILIGGFVMCAGAKK